MDKETEKTGTITHIDRAKGGIYIKPDDANDNNEYFAHIGDTLENEKKLLKGEIPFEEGNKVKFSVFIPNKRRAMHVQHHFPATGEKKP